MPIHKHTVQAQVPCGNSNARKLQAPNWEAGRSQASKLHVHAGPMVLMHTSSLCNPFDACYHFINSFTLEERSKRNRRYRSDQTGHISRDEHIDCLGCDCTYPRNAAMHAAVLSRWP